MVAEKVIPQGVYMDWKIKPEDVESEWVDTPPADELHVKMFGENVDKFGRLPVSPPMTWIQEIALLVALSDFEITVKPARPDQVFGTGGVVMMKWLYRDEEALSHIYEKTFYMREVCMRVNNPRLNSDGTQTYDITEAHGDPDWQTHLQPGALALYLVENPLADEQVQKS
jgi:hypothetical protein